MMVPVLFALLFAVSFFLSDGVRFWSSMLAMYAIAWPAMQFFLLARRSGTAWLYTGPASRQQLAKRAVHRALLCTLPMTTLVVGSAVLAYILDPGNSPSTTFAFHTVCICSGYLLMAIYCIGYRRIGKNYLALITAGIILVITLSLLYLALASQGILVLGALTILSVVLTLTWGHRGLENADLLPAPAKSRFKDAELLYGSR